MTIKVDSKKEYTSQLDEIKNLKENLQKEVEKRELLEDILAMMPEHVYWVNKEGVYLGCNDNQAKSAGLVSRQDIVGKRNKDLPWNFNAGTLPTKLDEINQQVMQTGRPQVVEEPATLMDGSNAMFLSNKVPLRNKQGKIIGMAGISVDITDRKQKENNLENRLQEAEIALEHVIANLPGHVYWKDKSGVYLGCNDSQAESLGVASRAEVIGKTDFDFSTKEEAEKFRENDLEVINSGENKIIEENAIVNGKPSIVLSHKVPLRNKKREIVGVLGISLDITALKNYETKLQESLKQSEASNKAKSEFLDNMRHDLRTPASGIVGFSHIIKEEAKEPNVKEYADNLIASGNALLDFLDEILDAISISTGEVPLMKKPFDLREEIAKIIDLNRAKAKEKKLEFSLAYDDNIPKYLLGDPKRIQRIFLELISNALNFTHKGHVKAAVSLAKENGREKIIKIEVEDTGIGIPEERKDEIFLRFKRLTPAYQGIYKGAGLGLSIVKQFIDELRGEIKVKSGKEGSTFTCLIPLEEPLLSEQEEQTTPQKACVHPVPAKKKVKAKAKEESAPTQKVTTKSKILVVEDDDISADIAKMVLEALDCEIDIAENGETALKLFQERRLKPAATGDSGYDLIFMDIGLPDMDGYQVTQRIRALEWKSDHHIPIIALSAHATTEHKQSCIEKGMTAMLIKPLVKEKAADILNAFIPDRVKKESTSIPKASKPKEEAKNKLLVIEGPVIDLAIAAQIGIPQKTLEEKILPLLVKSVPGDIRQLQEAYQKEDWKAVEEIAHKLKGSGAYCGAVRMKEACSRLEAYMMGGGRRGCDSKTTV